MKKRLTGSWMGLSMIAALTVSATAQTTLPVTRCWQRSSSGGTEGWNAQTMSMGNEGSEVFTCVGPLNDYTRIFSAFDTTPPQPTLHYSSSEFTSRHRTESADRSDVHVSLYDVSSPGTSSNLRSVVINKYSASRQDWTYTFPHETNGHMNNFVDVSNDGRTIVAASQNIFNGFSFDIAFFQENYSSSQATPTVVSYTPPGVFRDFDMSDNGRHFLIAGSSGIQVGDVATRQITHSAPFPFGDTFASRVVLSGTGRYLAYATQTRIRIFERGTSSYNLRHTYNIPGTGVYEVLLDFSENDELLAAGINYSPSQFAVRVTSFDVTAPGGPAVRFSKLLNGGGSYDERIADIAAAANGKRFAVGTWGNDQNLIPEILVYNRGNSEAIATIDLPGSVWDIDIAPDGKRVGVGYKHLHANIFASTPTSYSLYEIGRRDFRLRGVPKLGNTLEFTARVRTGASSKLLCSPFNPNYTPADYLGLGTAYVDTNNMTISHLGTGNFNNEATRTFSTNSPHFAQLAGQSLCFQGLVLSNRHLTRDWVQTTLLP